MSTFKSIEETLKALETHFDKLEEASKGGEGEGNAISETMDKIKEVVDTIGQLFTSLAGDSWWSIISGFFETLEKLLKLVAKAAGSALELLINLLAKTLTFGSQMTEAIREATGD